MRQLKILFAKQPDPYAGADIGLARRLGGMFWAVSALLSIALWPLSPIDREIGDAGWALGAALAALGLSFAVALRSSRFQLGFEGILVSCYVGAIGIATMQWLAGGGTAPYNGLLLLLLLLMAATNPLRRLAPFMACVGMMLVIPLLYSGWESDTAAQGLASFVIWTPLAFLVFMMMSSIRLQRLAMRREEEQAREEARCDELTAIGNRRAFDEALQNELARAGRMEAPLTMAMGDIEHFKRINDEFGHLEGDRCLQRVARAMDEELRTPDRVFRWGGDEFVLLLPGTTQEDAEVLMDRLQAKVSAACRRPDNETIWIHFAAAELRPGMSATGLAEAADLALMAERGRTHRQRA